MRPFDYSRDYARLDLRRNPELYAIGKGEQGVLMVEPYKSEILPHWRFKDAVVAQESADAIFGLFLGYLEADDFVGADMARKYLQMGYTRARRYANYPGGKKYQGPVPAERKGQSGAHGRQQRERGPEDPEKAAAARIFKAGWEAAKAHPRYRAQRQAFLARYG